MQAEFTFYLLQSVLFDEMNLNMDPVDKKSETIQIVRNWADQKDNQYVWSWAEA